MSVVNIRGVNNPRIDYLPEENVCILITNADNINVLELGLFDSRSITTLINMRAIP